MTKYRIPVRVVSPLVVPRRTRAAEAASPKEPTDAGLQAEETAIAAASSSAADAVDADAPIGDSGGLRLDAAHRAAQEGTPGTGEKVETRERAHAYRTSEVEEWKARTLRLQAEMEAYRQRQRRIAQEQAQTEQIALLRDVLVVADDLDRALAAVDHEPDRRSDPLTQGVEMTRSALERTLARYGLERFQVQGKPFDPAWHQAVHVVPATAFGVTPGTVVEVLENGYRRRGALFRPAKVVVAQ